MRNSFVLFFLLFSLSTFAKSSVLDIWQNNQAVDQMQQKKMLEAHDEFTQLIGKEPFHPVYQFNLGSSFLGIEDVEKAIKMYEEIKKLNPLPPQIELATYYNLGVLYAMSKKIDLALENYQKALALSPESKEIKINIELLFKGQGKGGGKGDNKDKSKKQDKKDKGDKEQQEPKEFTNKKQQPDQFKSKDMSKNDVKKILNELKKQEQRIRAKHERKGKKEADREKSW